MSGLNGETDVTYEGLNIEILFSLNLFKLNR